MQLGGFSETHLIWGSALAVVAVVVLPYLLIFRSRLARDLERKREAAQLGIDRPVAQFPFIDANRCIGCRTCVAACPEGDVLGIVGGTAVVVNGLRCVGHARCEAVCPVGAIEVGLGDLKMRRDVPLLDGYETTSPGIFVAGELGGLALVRNAALQGREAIEVILERLRSAPGGLQPQVHQVAVVGAGPAGLAAGLAAAAAGLDYVVLEKEADLGGSLLHYPRRKMVLTQPVELPPWGRLDREHYEKEELLSLFSTMVRDLDLRVHFGAAVEHVEREDGHFVLRTAGGLFRARYVLLTIGRRGSPRKLGVPGEELSKVMYRLLDAESYAGQRVLVVGGGDSAVEAAIGLARQRGAEVTLSYRKDKLVRIKKKNQDTVEPLLARGRIRALMPSQVVEIRRGSVLIEAGGERLEIANDYVFVFAGGVPPFAFLQKLGVRFGGEGVEASPAASLA